MEARGKAGGEGEDRDYYYYQPGKGYTPGSFLYALSSDLIRAESEVPFFYVHNKDVCVYVRARVYEPKLARRHLGNGDIRGTAIFRGTPGARPIERYTVWANRLSRREMSSRGIVRARSRDRARIHHSC